MSNFIILLLETIVIAHHLPKKKSYHLSSPSPACNRIHVYVYDLCVFYDNHSLLRPVVYGGWVGDSVVVCHPGHL